MIKKVLASLLIVLTITTGVSAHSAQINKNIEVFHIEEDQVIKSIPLNDDIQHATENIVKGISNLYKKFNPIPPKGYMIKVPLEPPIKVENQWFNDLVDQVIIIFPENEESYLLLFTDENTPFFLTFKGNTNILLSKLNFNPS